MILAPAGVREWGGSGVLLGGIVAATWLLGASPWIAWTVTCTAAMLWLAIAAFFRDPPRPVPPDLATESMLSPADGRITVIEDLEHHDAVEGPATLVRIFLSVLNVHINRMPCDSTVRDLQYAPGRFLDARNPESARVNESMLVRLHRSDGVPIGVRQVSGAIARRIVCPIATGDRFARGERFGMIKFGSTTELVVPRDAVAMMHVAVGDCVRAGRSVLLDLRSTP